MGVSAYDSFRKDGLDRSDATPDAPSLGELNARDLDPLRKHVGPCGGGIYSGQGYSPGWSGARNRGGLPDLANLPRERPGLLARLADWLNSRYY